MRAVEHFAPLGFSYRMSDVSSNETSALPMEGYSVLWTPLRPGRATEAVFAELEKAEGQKKVLQQRLARLDDANRFANQDTAGLKRDLFRRVTNMKELLGKHVPQTRQLLRKLIEGRIVCTPFQDHRGRGYELAATGTYAGLLGDLGMVNYGGGGEGS